ncbi:MAG: hypothetical protein WA071_00775 [Undibacterium umbellatum]|uniref:hypothetical protein n=1 Tax=Undibacterium umbellatum TaxID=2762300 RepID=UPI003BB7F913
MYFLISHLFGRIPAEDRPALLKSLVEHGSAIGLVVDIVGHFIRQPDEEVSDNQWYAEFSVTFIKELNDILIRRLNLVPVSTFLKVPDLRTLLYIWREIGGGDSIFDKFHNAIDENSLPILLEKFLKISHVYGDGDYVSREIFEIDPQELATVIDINELKPRVALLSNNSNLTVRQRKAVESYLEAVAKAN